VSGSSDVSGSETGSVSDSESGSAEARSSDERRPPDAGRSCKAGLKASDVVPYLVTSGVTIAGITLMSAGLAHFGDTLNLVLVIVGVTLVVSGMLASALCPLLRR
jgi:hypothetical protein